LEPPNLPPKAPTSKLRSSKPERSAVVTVKAVPSAVTDLEMSCAEAQPSTPRAVRTSNQSVRRRRIWKLSSRDATWKTG
jgi:hypothetical protein